MSAWSGGPCEFQLALCEFTCCGDSADSALEQVVPSEAAEPRALEWRQF